MKIKKLTRVQWQNPQDAVALLRKNFDASLFIAKLEWQNKTKCFYIKHLDNTTTERLWIDKDSAKEFIQYQQYLATKYGGEILSFEILDVDLDL